MFNHVEYIYTVYQEKSFTKAAQRLYISQPSLSATVSKVEKEIGYPIFDRSGREVTLTYIGQKYIRAAEQIMQIRKNLANEIDDLVKLRKGKVVLGCTAFIACHFLPPLLKAFGRKYPDVEVQLKVEQSTMLRERLEKGMVDIVIDNVLFKEPNYTYLPLLQEQILIGVPVELEANKRLEDFRLDPRQLCQSNCNYEVLPKVDMSLFRDEAFILLKSGNKMRQIAHSIFSENGMSPKVGCEFDLLLPSISFAENGYGICFVPDSLLKCAGYSDKLAYYQPNTKNNTRTLYIFYRSDKYMTFAGKELIEFLQVNV